MILRFSFQPDLALKTQNPPKKYLGPVLDPKMTCFGTPKWGQTWGVLSSIWNSSASVMYNEYFRSVYRTPNCTEIVRVRIMEMPTVWSRYSQIEYHCL